MSKFFDLNIGKILEHWECRFAVRELIANAIDETVLSKASIPFSIVYDETTKTCTIRDFGRGINYEHLIQNESKEKAENMNVIGKFGFGLKDAIATFYRSNIEIEIKSRYGLMTVVKQAKHDFENIETLHIKVDPIDPVNHIVGTEIKLREISKEEVEKAKELFLIYSNDATNILLTSIYGQIIKKTGTNATIYINGIKVAEESQYKYSYNVTSLTTSMRKALNRERNNVGRSVYGERIAKILCQITDKDQTMISDIFLDLSKNPKPDDLNYKDVQIHIIKLSNSDKVLFVTSKDLIMNKSDVDLALNDGIKEVIVSEDIMKTIFNMKDTKGEYIKTIQQFNKTKLCQKYTIVPLTDLKDKELKILNTHVELKNLIYPTDKYSRKYILEIASDLFSKAGCLGLCTDEKNQILIDRTMLTSLDNFSGVFLHELTHFYTGFKDIDRNFEFELTKHLGTLASKVIKT